MGQASATMKYHHADAGDKERGDLASKHMDDFMFVPDEVEKRCGVIASDGAGDLDLHPLASGGGYEGVARFAKVSIRSEEPAVSKKLTDIARQTHGVASDAAGNLLGGPQEPARTVTAVSSHMLAAPLQRQELGMLQSELFPVYFRAMAYGVGLAVAAHLRTTDPHHGSALASTPTPCCLNSTAMFLRCESLHVRQVTEHRHPRGGLHVHHALGVGPALTHVGPTEKTESGGDAAG